jgi:ribA/ribD-fused uncharacterized protein
MNDGLKERIYLPRECVVFRKTKEQYGGLSNMASGFPLRVNGVSIWSSEALYQACRFPARSDIQKLIIAERSPMTAKMKSKRFREFTRVDWEIVKLKVMRWCLRVKLAQNWRQFSELLLSTGQKPIVEESHKDVFWGAKRLENGTLVGTNILGRFLVELRQQLVSPSSDELLSVPPPDISQFLLLGRSIGVINADLGEVSKGVSSVEQNMSTFPQSASSFPATPQLSTTELQQSSDLAWSSQIDADTSGMAGVHLAGLKITKELRYIFRPKPISDIGIDAEIEIRSQGKGNGRLIAAQIKSGERYLRERTLTGFVFRGSTEHLQYWLAYAVPVILIICDPNSETCWWQLVDLQGVRFHKSGWSTEIPFSQRLDASAAAPLLKISSRFQKRDIVDIVFRNWLLKSNYYELVLADVIEQPRDYQWFRYLGRRRNAQYVMADYVMADLKSFPPTEIDEMVRWAEANHRTFTYDKFILGLISETIDAFPIGYRPKLLEPGLAVELVPLLLKLDNGADLCELGADGSLITSYFNHTAWDGWARPVEQQRIEISASVIA